MQYWVRMLLIFIAAIAAQLSAPEPVNPLSWFRPTDMPSEVISKAIPRIVATRTVVAPSGKIQSCEVEVSSGDAELDAFTCGLILKRGKFRPARWIDGSPTYGVHRQGVTWVVNPPPPEPPGDLELSVDQLPRRVRSPAYLALMFAVDEEGRPSHCAPWEIPGIQNENYALAPVACPELIKNYKAKPVIDESGSVSRSVQNASVRIVKKQTR